MPRKTFATMLPFLAVMALLSPGKAVAGPPEGVSGKMTFLDATPGLQAYRKEKDDKKRSEWRERLAPSRDPRVAIMLWETFCDESESVEMRCDALDLLRRYFVEGTRFQEGTLYHCGDWWEANEADLRLRATQLSQ